MKALKQQADDIALLLRNMRGQFVELQAAYDRELVKMENAFLRERQVCLCAWGFCVYACVGARV